MKKSIFYILVSTMLFVTNPVYSMAMEDPDLKPRESIGKPPTWKFLEEGDTIEIIAPSAAPLNNEQIPAVKELIIRHGLHPYLPEGAIDKEASHHSYFANSDEERARYFIEALQGPSKALWALLGGFGGAEVVAEVEYSSFVLPKKLKPIIGFGDITALHLLAATWGWPSLHGPVIGIGEELFPVIKSDDNKYTKLSSIFSILRGEVSELEYPFEVIYSGASSLETPILGSVIGGNLSIIQGHKGTPTALNGKDRFVFFEDTTEEWERLSSQLVGLISAGVFAEAKGIIVGNLPILGYEDSQQVTKDFIKKIVEGFLIPRGIHIPVIYSSRFGHGDFNDVMPLGTTASLYINGAQATLRISVNDSAYK